MLNKFGDFFKNFTISNKKEYFSNLAEFVWFFSSFFTAVEIIVNSTKENSNKEETEEPRKGSWISRVINYKFDYRFIYIPLFAVVFFQLLIRIINYKEQQPDLKYVSRGTSTEEELMK